MSEANDLTEGECAGVRSSVWLDGSRSGPPASDESSPSKAQLAAGRDLCALGHNEYCDNLCKLWGCQVQFYAFHTGRVAQARSATRSEPASSKVKPSEGSALT